MLHNGGMNACPSKVALALGLLGLGTLCAPPAHATLSGDAASVRSDQIKLQGAPATLTRFSGFDKRTITTDSGLIVDEFLTPAGTVFALSWSGPVIPDLHQLLGRHYPAYLAALGQLSQPGLKRSLRIETDDFVVENAGHLRAFVGRAYVPSLLPRGLAARDLPW